MSEATYSNKRPKMGEVDGNTRPTCSQKIFDPVTQNFEHIRRTLGFVDNTDLIQLFFGSGTAFEPKKLFIFAPSHFCKSSNMDMIEKFFCTKEGGEVEENYKERYMFETFDGLKIMEETDPETLTNHFCAHPVLFVDFKTIFVTSYDDAVDSCFRTIWNAYKDHYDFLKEKLKDDGDKDVCQMWLTAVKWQDLGEANVKRGLANLTNILFNACKKRVLVLVDECDAIITAALTYGALKEIEQIAKFMEEVFGNVTKGDIVEKLQGVLFTGISYTCGFGYSRLIEATPYIFLLDKPEESENSATRAVIVRSYGLHEKHLQNLLARLDRKGRLLRSIEKETELIKSRYNGYYSQKGECILPLWSVLYYLVSHKMKVIHADIHCVGRYYKKAFEDVEVGRLVLKLIAKQEIRMEFIEKLDMSDLVRLQIVGTGGNLFYRNLLFSLLMEIGFLGNAEKHAPSSPGQLKVVVPNEEVRSIFQRMFRSHHIQIGQFDNCYVDQCKLIVDRLLLDHDTRYKTHLKSFHETLVELFKGFNWYNMDDFDEHDLQSLMWYVLTYTGKFEVIPDYNSKNNGRVDLWLKYKDKPYFIVLELKVCKEKLKDHSSLHALNQIKSEEGQISKLSGKKYLLIGLSMDAATFAPSISVQTSESAERIFVSKTEQAFECFGTYYEGCYDLFNEKYV